MQRGAYVGRADPGPFHCLSCKAYVIGTESGHCPRCGFVPPSAPAGGAVLEPIRWTTIVSVAGIVLALVLLLIR